jgi:hypothetical protein
MLTKRSSLTVLAVTAFLTIGFAPQASLAQSAGAATGGQAIKDYVEKQNDQLSKLDKDEADRQKNLAKQPVKPETAAGSTTGGKSGFPDPPPPPPPEEPGIIQSCINAICSWFSSSSDDEAKAQKEHNEAVHKAVEEKNKAEAEQKKVEQPKTAVSPAPTELKKVELKTAVAPKPTETVNIKNVGSNVASLHVAPRLTVTTTITGPTINVAHPTINIPRPTINIPTIHR